MPSRVGSSQFKALLVDGYDLLAGKLESFAWKVGNKLRRTDGLGDDWDEHGPTGRRIATVTQSGGFFDTNQNRVHDAMKAAPTGTTRILMLAPAGNTHGALFVGAQGVGLTAYDVIAKDGDLVLANVQQQVSGRLDDDGVVVQPHEAKTVDWNTRTDGFTIDYILNPFQTAIPITSNSLANPSVVTTTVPHGLATNDLVYISGVVGSVPDINGDRTVTVISATTFSVAVNVTTPGTGGQLVRGNSSFGVVGYQGVSALSGFTGFVGKIRDSPDNVTFADLVTFANVTSAPNAQRIEVAGVIDRYLSFVGDVTGSGSITVFAGSRRKSS